MENMNGLHAASLTSAAKGFQRIEAREEVDGIRKTPPKLFFHTLRTSFIGVSAFAQAVQPASAKHAIAAAGPKTRTSHSRPSRHDLPRQNVIVACT
jgi:hypothetical protein